MHKRQDNQATHQLKQQTTQRKRPSTFNKVLGNLRGNYAGAVLTLNPGVAIAQAAKQVGRRRAREVKAQLVHQLAAHHQCLVRLA